MDPRTIHINVLCEDVTVRSIFTISGTPVPSANGLFRRLKDPLYFLRNSLHSAICPSEGPRILVGDFSFRAVKPK